MQQKNRHPARTYTVGLRSDGTVVATGANSYGQCDVQNWRNIIAISAYETYTLGPSMCSLYSSAPFHSM